MLTGLSFTSERLFTKALSAEDIDALFEIYSDHDAMKFRGSRPVDNREDAIAMVEERYIVDQQSSKLRLGVRRKSDHELVGTLLLVQELTNEKNIELGFSFGRKYWGNGYGLETINMVMEELLVSKRIDEVTGWCRKENSPSITLFKKAGFEEIEQSGFPDLRLFSKRDAID